MSDFSQREAASFAYLNQILQNYDLGEVFKVNPLGQGRINQTFFVESSFGKFVLQKLHPELNSAVLEDIETVTNFLQKEGLTTPEIVKTNNNALGVVESEKLWRLLTYIPGKNFEKGVTKTQAYSAGRLLGQTHAVLKELNYDFKHSWPHFHEFNFHFKKLEKLTASSEHPEAKEVAKEILNHRESLPKDFRDLPQQVIHGDPKLPNFIFNDKNEAITLVDLDTFNKNSVLVDLADMVRSFCKMQSENGVGFNFEIYEEIVKGYEDASKLTPEEKSQVSNAVQLIMLELSARYLNDVYEQNYFNFDSSRFPSLADQNLFNATAQMQQFRSFTQKESSSE